MAKKRKTPVEDGFGTSDPDQKKHKVLIKVVIGLTVIITIIITYPFYMDGSNRTAPAKSSAPSHVASFKTETKSNREWQGLLPKQIAEKFIAATTHEERLRWIQNPQLNSDIMDQFFRSGAGRNERVAKIEEMPRAALDERILARFSVTMKDGSKRLLCIPFDEGGGLVDFRTYARHCSASWESLLDGSVTNGTEMRLFLQKSSYYNHGFTDEKRWLSLIGTSPDLSAPVYLFVRIDDSEIWRYDNEMSRLIKNPPARPTRYTVAIENIDNSHRNRSFVIWKVIHPGWAESRSDQDAPQE